MIVEAAPAHTKVTHAKYLTTKGTELASDYFRLGNFQSLPKNKAKLLEMMCKATYDIMHHMTGLA